MDIGEAFFSSKRTFFQAREPWLSRTKRRCLLRECVLSHQLKRIRAQNLIPPDVDLPSIAPRSPPPPPRVRIPSWPSEPAGPCTCRFSDRGDADGATHRNPYPRHRSAFSKHPPNGACHAARAMFFFWERPCRYPLGVFAGGIVRG